MLFRSYQQSHVFFKTDGKAKRGSAGKCIDIGAFQSHLGPEACSKVLALHASVVVIQHQPSLAMAEVSCSLA